MVPYSFRSHMAQDHSKPFEGTPLKTIRKSGAPNTKLPNMKCRSLGLVSSCNSEKQLPQPTVPLSTEELKNPNPAMDAHCCAGTHLQQEDSSWAHPRGPTHVGPAWAHPRGPLGPTHVGPTWALIAKLFPRCPT